MKVFDHPLVVLSTLVISLSIQSVCGGDFTLRHAVTGE